MDPLDFSQFDMAENGEAGAPETGASAEGPAVVAVANVAAGARVLSLLAPPAVDGKRLRRIVLRGLLQGDIDDLLDGTLPSRRALLCRLTGQPAAVIKVLQWPDSRVLHEMFIDALPDFLKE